MTAVTRSQARRLSENFRGESSREQEVENEKLQKKIKAISKEVKKLKGCLDWYMKQEDEWDSTINKLRALQKSRRNRHYEIEANLSFKVDELTVANEILKCQLVEREKRQKKLYETISELNGKF